VSEFSGRTCTAPAARSERMRDIVAGAVARHAPIRVLDLGCGTGSLVFRLAEILPHATIVGIDVSPANIRAAERQVSLDAGGRIRFAVSDYLEFRDEPFDAVVSDGVLHLIPAPTDALVHRLAADLRQGGLLICDMPYDCAYNRAFTVARRVLRALRSPLTDRAILAVGRALHGREMDDNGLRERVGYMYVPPERVMGPALARAFARAGLRQVATHAMPSTSPSQLRHSVTIFTKDAAAA